MKMLFFGQVRLLLQSATTIAATAVGCLLCVAGGAQAQTTTLNHTGAAQTYTVPVGAVAIRIQARGAGGGGAGSDGVVNTNGGAGGAGALAQGDYPVSAGTVLNVYVGGRGGAGQSNEANSGNTCLSTAGSAGVASGGYAGGAGSTAGCSPYSGGGGGGGAASVVATSAAAPILIAGGGGGGQGGSLGGNGVVGVSSSATGNIATPSAGLNAAAPGSDGGGGGGGGGGCPGGTGGLFKPDNNPPNPNTPAGAGSSCGMASVSSFSVTASGGGAGGTGAVWGNFFRNTGSGATDGTHGQVIITPIYQVAVVKTGPTVLTLGTSSAYTLTVTNTGIVAATTARVLDQLPVGMTYNSASGSGWTCSAAAPDGNGTLVTCNFTGSIAVAGTSVLTINATPTTSTTKINRASIDRSGGTAPPAALNCTGADTPSTGCAAPVTSSLVELAVVKTQDGPSPMLFGNNNFYGLVVTNSGSAAATSATVQDQLPVDMTYVNSSSSAPGWSCVADTPNLNGTRVTCTFTGTIAANGGTTRLQINVTPVTSSSKTNRASVDRTGGTAPPAALGCTAVNTPSLGCAAPVISTMVELTIAKSQPSPALQVGINSTYTITVNNFGSSVATTARFRDQLPASLDFVSAAGSGWTCGATPPGGGALVTCDFAGSVASGVDLPTVALIVRPTLNQTVINRLAVAPRGGLGVPIIANCTAQGLPDRGCGAPVTSLMGSSQLSGVVFLDTGIGSGGLANNGLIDGTETGLGGVLVEARNASLVVVASTTTAGNGSYTLTIPAGAGALTVTPVLPSGFLATGGTPGDTTGSYTRPTLSYTPVNGTIRTLANFGTIPPNTFLNSGTQTTTPGSVVFYSHNYVAGSVGNVTFALSAVSTPVFAGWTQVLYQDTNCDAVLDAGELQVAAPVALIAGQQICLILRQQVPPGATLGMQNVVSISATMDYANDSPALAPSVLLLTDTTTIAAGSGLALSKLVRNFTTGGSFLTTSNALPGQTLEYSVTATNNGSQPVGSIVINDATPAFTNFVSATCPGTLPPGITLCTVSTQPGVGLTGAVQWTLTGSLTPSAQIAVTFRVLVNQ